MLTKEEVLQQCTIDGNVVRLPEGQLTRKVYLEVADALNLIGGTWKGGKVKGFVFLIDPTDLLNKVANGEKKNLKKEFQFFETPKSIANWLVTLAAVKPEHTILEPSAGQGAIIEAVLRQIPEANVFAVELMDVNSHVLNQKGFKHRNADFLSLELSPIFDRIIANPPFAKNQDIDHIYKMYECTKPGGRVVSIASKHWQLSTNKKETNFRNWLEERKAFVCDIPAGQFKESGTSIATVAIVIDKC